MIRGRRTSRGGSVDRQCSIATTRGQHRSIGADFEAALDGARCSRLTDALESSGGISAADDDSIPRRADFGSEARVCSERRCQVPRSIAV